jgi:hypothetical protein
LPFVYKFHSLHVGAAVVVVGAAVVVVGAAVVVVGAAVVVVGAAVVVVGAAVVVVGAAVVVVGAAVVVVVGAAVVVVGAAVVVVGAAVVVVGITPTVNVIPFSHIPFDITCISVALSDTSITLPANNSEIFASNGSAYPTLGIRKNLGPNEIPYPALSVTVTNIF